MPIALRIKLRPWKNRIKKIHMNAKELSFLGGWTERGREREGEMREREPQRGGRGERDICMITMITQHPGPLTCRHSTNDTHNNIDYQKQPNI